MSFAAARPKTSSPPRPLSDRVDRPDGGARPALTIGVGLGFALVAFIAQGGQELNRTTKAEVGLMLLGGAICVAALLRAPPTQRRWGMGTLAAMALLAAVTALSIAWSVQPSDSWVEANRTLSYLAALAAGLALARLAPRCGRAVVGAVALGGLLVCAWALLTKVFPGALNPNEYHARLRAPFDYWNAIGLEAALTVPALLWLGARREASPLRRALAYPGVGLAVATILLSYSRGAILAVGIGLVVWFALVPLRLRALRVGLVGAAGGGLLAAWAFGRSALTEEHVALAARTHSGHLLGVALIIMCALLLAAGFALEKRVELDSWPERVRRGIGLAAVSLLALGLLLAAFSGGGLGARWHELTNANVPTPPNDPSRLTATSSVRARYWKEATKVWDDHRWLGSGAAGFALARIRYRSDQLQVRHAHGYFPQTLADLGLLGLAASLALLAAWLAAALRATGLRHRSEDAAGAWPTERIALVTLAATVVTFGAHSLLDWTYFIPGNAVIALVVAGYVAGQPPWEPRGSRLDAASARGRPNPARLLAAAGIVALTLAAVWSMAQPTRSESARDDALAEVSRGHLAAAAADARAAHDRNPLSVEPLFAQSIVADAMGNPRAASEALRAAVRLQPSNPSPWRELGDYQLSVLHEPAAALASLRAAVFLDPRSVAAQAEFLRAYRAVHPPATAPPPPADRNPGPAPGSS